MQKNNFELAKDTYLEKLKMFVPIVDRVHGKNHPEFHEVKALFEKIESKINQADYKLDYEFNTLKKVTSNYEVPEDVCESYEAVYQMLATLNKAYDQLGA